MGVLQLDCTNNIGDAELDLTSAPYAGAVPEVWAEFDVAFNAAYITAATASAFSQLVLEVRDSSNDIFTVDVIRDGLGGFTIDTYLDGAAYPLVPEFAPTPAITSNQFYHFKIHILGHPTTPTIEIWKDGTLVGSFTGTGDMVDVALVRLRQGGMATAGALQFYDNFTLGTTSGASDIVADAFEGTLAVWNGGTFDATIVADPGIAPAVPAGGSPPPPPQGILVAFDDDALADDPTYTRLDDPNGYRLASSVTIERGRDDVSQQMATATATVTFIDREGLLDPTNPDGPFYGKLLPRLQAKIQRWNPVTDEWDTRFKGFTKAWRYSIDPSGNLSTCRLEIVGPFEFITTLVMTPGDQGHTPPPESVGDIYFKGGPADMVHVNSRIHKALDDFDWPRGPNWRRIYSGNVYVQDKVYERFTQGLPVLQDAADAEFPWIANFFEGMVPRRGFGSGIVIFHGRYARFRPEVSQYDIRFWKVGDGAVATEDPGTVPFVDDLPFHISDEELYNVAEPLPEGIDDSDAPGQLTKNDASITKYGRRPVPSLDNLQTYRGNSHGIPPTTALQETKLFGEFLVENYKDPVVQVDSLTIRSRGVDHPNAEAIWEFLNKVELNDVITLNTTHKGGGGFDEDFFVDKITESDEPNHVEGMPDLHDVTMQLDLTPRSRYENNPFSPYADNDDMGGATPLDGGTGGSGELTATSYGFSNDGPATDPGGGDPWDPLREQFFTADDPADPGNPLPSNHNFRTAWFSFSTSLTLDLHVEVDVPAAGAAIIVTTDPAPPPSNRDAVLASAGLAAAGTIDLGTVSLSDQDVWIGVGSYGDDGFEFTVRWDATV